MPSILARIASCSTMPALQSETTTCSQGPVTQAKSLLASCASSPSIPLPIGAAPLLAIPVIKKPQLLQSLMLPVLKGHMAGLSTAYMLAQAACMRWVDCTCRFLCGGSSGYRAEQEHSSQAWVPLRIIRPQACLRGSMGCDIQIAVQIFTWRSLSTELRMATPHRHGFHCASSAPSMLRGPSQLWSICMPLVCTSSIKC